MKRRARFIGKLPRLPPAGSPAAMIAVVLLLGAVACGAPPPRDLVLLTVDTLRADALGGRDGEASDSPNLDRLLASGTSFTQAIAPMPRTTPALGTLLTGLWPHHHGSREVGDPIGDVVTLAEVLSRRGWDTLAVVANSTAGTRQRLHRGFRRFVDFEELERTYGARLYRDLADVGAEDSVGWAAVVTDRALALLGERDPDKPLFLWLFYFDPHFIYLPPPPFFDPAEGGDCWQLYQSFDGRRREGGQIFADIGGVASAALESCRELYRAEVRYLDVEIGRLLAGLSERLSLEDALVVFTADHGENFGEDGLFFEHGPSAHDAGLRVPLAFVGPGIAAGGTDGSSTGLVDVVPTVLELLGVPSDDRPSADGIDLTPRLRHRTPPPDSDRPLFAESASSMWNEAVELLITGRPGWRTCVNDERFSLCRSGEPPSLSWELFDHQADPELTTDLSAEHPDAVARLAEGFHQWPDGVARQRVARTSRWKLVQLPRLDGGNDSRLIDLAADPAESQDVKRANREVFRRLSNALEQWVAGQPESETRTDDPAILDNLRDLGYLGGGRD